MKMKAIFCALVSASPLFAFSNMTSAGVREIVAEMVAPMIEETANNKIPEVIAVIEANLHPIIKRIVNEELRKAGHAVYHHPDNDDVLYNGECYSNLRNDFKDVPTEAAQNEFPNIPTETAQNEFPNIPTETAQNEIPKKFSKYNFTKAPI